MPVVRMQRTSPLPFHIPLTISLTLFSSADSWFHMRCSDVALAWTQILNGLGGGISVVCVNVMVQASVPHEDMGIVISNLALWTKLFGAISTAVGEFLSLHPAVLPLFPGSVPVLTRWRMRMADVGAAGVYSWLRLDERHARQPREVPFASWRQRD